MISSSNMGHWTGFITLHFVFFVLFYALNTPCLKMLETCGKATNLRVEHDFRLYVYIYMHIYICIYIYTPYVHTCVNNVPFARITLFQKRWSWRKQDGCRSKLIGSLNLDGPIEKYGRFGGQSMGTCFWAIARVRNFSLPKFLFFCVTSLFFLAGHALLIFSAVPLIPSYPCRSHRCCLAPQSPVASSNFILVKKNMCLLSKSM